MERKGKEKERELDNREKGKSEMKGKERGK